MKALIAILSVCMFSSEAFGRELELDPFTTDGCSVSPDGTPHSSNPFREWRHCCIIHDVSYWMGGTYRERYKADNELRKCISTSLKREGRRSVGAIISALYFLGVRLGGGPRLPFSFRWTYGWNEYRGYAPLTLEQKAMVREELEILKEEIEGGPLPRRWGINWYQTTVLLLNLEKRLRAR